MERRGKGTALIGQQRHGDERSGRGKAWRRMAKALHSRVRTVSVTVKTQKINQTKSTHGEGFSFPNTQEKTMGILIAVFGLGIVIGTFSGIVLTSLAKAAKDEGRKEDE